MSTHKRTHAHAWGVHGNILACECTYGNTQAQSGAHISVLVHGDIHVHATKHRWIHKEISTCIYHTDHGIYI